MPLHLKIENLSSLPDGGPLEISLEGRRGIDIGRDQYLDWPLPDPDRVVSGKHAEIRFRDGGYWLTDVSRNGTFLNRNPQRLQEPHRLADGDRIEIGHYVIATRLSGETAPETPQARALQSAAPDAYWAPAGEVAPAIPARDLRPPSAARPVRPDFIDWAIDVPAPGGEPAAGWAAPTPAAESMDWAAASPPPRAPEPPPLPTPRRPGPVADAASWEAEPPAAPPAQLDWQLPPLPGASIPVAEAVLVPPPPHAEPPPVAASVPTRSAQAPAADEILRRFAKGAGVPLETVAWREAGDMAEELGALLRLATENVKQLLAARAEAKRAARTNNQTMIQALDNNPLKFAPSVDDALRIMLGRPSGGYLDSRRALEAGFRDLKTHQLKTYSAMQNAVRLLLDDLAPEAIAESDDGDRGLGGLLGSRKARLWDLYASRWDGVASAHEDGMTGAFTLLFAECYESGR